MSKSSNIDLFNEITGKTLAFLYENFPLEKTILVKNLIDDAPLDVVLENGATVPSKECEIAFATVKWLIGAGYISAKIYPYTAFGDAVLTAKGLELLKLMPDSLTESFGDTLLAASKGAVTEGTKDVIGQVTSKALTAGLSILWQGISTLGS
ncbi:hypothetical protein GVN99_15435 [Serratia marcescens]|uniref:hypothetical protein n=1 Tax=Serratia TaxID=613 RepID=UPI000F7F8221|nr:hypothetical protein [Serratia marcescens]NSM20506.1 hypothetical protein [Serratia marcescens]NSM47765.1 hypothetical protein [Serratia marcescens]QLJ60264.1 hypothetical protein HP475_10175 [Serratia marcescens]HCU0895063.1 hypothetical protein [Serratia marcescens]HEJ7097873.1 hypothetical protein [Serratia marcescens]